MLKLITVPLVALWSAIRSLGRERGGGYDAAWAGVIAGMMICMFIFGGCSMSHSPVESAIRAMNPTVSLKCQVVVEAGGIPIVGMTGSCVAGVDDQSCWTEQSGVLIRAPVKLRPGAAREAEGSVDESTK